MGQSNPNQVSESERRGRNYDKYWNLLQKVESGELVIPGWDKMSEMERIKALCPEYAEEVRQLRATKYGPGGKG